MNQELGIRNKNRKGFTLMEIVVATTIFAVTVSLLMALFNYTLKINRRTEALRQATQGMRNLVEFLVKEVRNGSIDYGVINGNTPLNPPLAPCVVPAITAVVQDSYMSKDNKLGLITPEGQRECIYYADQDGTYVPLASPNAFAAPTTTGVSYKLMIAKAGGIKESLMPNSNFKIDQLMFFVRPLCDPYAKCDNYSDTYPAIQPSVTMFIKFTVLLPTGEQVPIYYQTLISVNKYDIPH